MKLPSVSILCLVLAANGAFAADACCTASPALALAAAAPAAATPAGEASKPAPAGHALRGVVVAVLAEKSALLVKHEEIPGVMRAMTMLLRVDAATLAAAKKDQAITGTLVRRDDAWWLENVRPVAP